MMLFLRNFMIRKAKMIQKFKMRVLIEIKIYSKSMKKYKEKIKKNLIKFILHH